MTDLNILVTITLIVTLSDLGLNIYKTINQKKSDKKRLQIEESKMATSGFSNVISGFKDMIPLIEEIKKLAPEKQREEIDKRIKSAFEKINFDES